MTMSYLHAFQEVPPDPILGLAATYKKDPNPNKINLAIGEYRTEEGSISLLKCVYEAEKLLLQEKQNKGYPPIDGEASFKEELLRLVAPFQPAKSFYVAHTVGSTSALRLAGDLLKQMGFQKILMSEPTWPNHPHLFRSSHLEIGTFSYYDSDKNELRMDKICSSLEAASPHTAVLLQLCCHNPTGRDPNLEQWAKIITIIKKKKLFPVIDCAYQGFGQGFNEDILPLQLILEELDEAFLCYSCAKNLGLYGERVGAFIAFDKSQKNIENLGANARVTIRGNYSTPPIHGARIVKTILQSSELRQIWMDELTEMRHRIKELRQLFLKNIEKRNLPQNFKYLIEDQGLFSLLNIAKEDVLKLRAGSGVYLLDNGRINIAGLSQKNMEYVCSSIQQVLIAHD